MIPDDNGPKRRERPPEPSLPAKPIQRRLLIPLAGVLLLLVAGFGAVLAALHQHHANEFSRHLLKDVSAELTESLAEQSEALAALQEVILRGRLLRDALEAGDPQRLLRHYRPIFARLREQHGVTHFYVHGPDRTNLVRVHNPVKSGDRIDRFTARQAERTGQIASGIELGRLGTFTLRVVRPVYGDQGLVGYLELGMEIEDLLADIRGEHDAELAVVIHKAALDRTKWQAGMAMLGRESDWDRYADEALIYTSLPRFPSECDPFVAEDPTGGEMSAEIEFHGKSWRALVSPLADASGAEVGDLIILHDVSEANAAFNRLLAVGAGASAALLVVLFGFLYAVLQRTDRSIRAQQADLQKSEAFQRAVSEALPDFVFVLDRDGRILSANRVHPGHRVEDVLGQKVSTFIPPEWRDAYQDALRQALDTRQVQTLETAVDLPDGQRHFLSRLSPTPIAGVEDSVVLISTDITKRKRTEEKLRQKMAQLERFNRLSLGRELRMLDMKREVNEMARKAGVAPPYDSPDHGPAHRVASAAAESPTPAEAQE